LGREGSLVRGPKLQAEQLALDFVIDRRPRHAGSRKRVAAVAQTVVNPAVVVVEVAHDGDGSLFDAEERCRDRPVCAFPERMINRPRWNPPPATPHDVALVQTKS